MTPQTEAGVTGQADTRSLEHATTLFNAGRLEAARSVCLDLLKKEIPHAATLNLLGMIAGVTQQLDAAINYFHRALADAPDHAIIHGNLAEALRRRGKPQAALDICLSGLSRNPQDHNLNGLAAELLIQSGQYLEATPRLLTALQNAPGHHPHWQRFNRLLGKVALEPSTGRRWLLKALCHPCTRPRDIAGSVAATLCSDPDIAGLIDLAARRHLPREKALDDMLSRLGSDDLLLQLMVTTPIPLPSLERCFTDLRRHLLFDIGSHPFSMKSLHFTVALSIQSFLTDYAWRVSTEEEAAVDKLVGRIDTSLQGQGLPADLLLFRLALVGAYRPLHEMNKATEFTKGYWPKSMETLIRVQITEPLEELALQARIPALTPISGSISRLVRAQYEEHPYPRWVSTGNLPRLQPLPDLMTEFGWTAPADPAFRTPDVLIAGCGTGQQSISAAYSYVNARILAFDLSLASLAYASRKTRELGIDNIDYRHGDIMELGVLERSFHVIECVGVLHHMADPIAGWRILADKLLPGGVMVIGLYSELARQAVVLARRDIAMKGYTATVDDIRRWRCDLSDLPADDPMSSLRHNNVFYNISECRDLVFHVQEHRFTLPEIREALDDLGLRFLGFVLADKSAYKNRFPDDPLMRSLTNWHAFEQDHPDTFANMYHFWVQKAPPLPACR